MDRLARWYKGFVQYSSNDLTKQTVALLREGAGIGQKGSTLSDGVSLMFMLLVGNYR